MALEVGVTEPISFIIFFHFLELMNHLQLSIIIVTFIRWQHSWFALTPTK